MKEILTMYSDKNGMNMVCTKIVSLLSVPMDKPNWLPYTPQTF